MSSTTVLSRKSSVISHRKSSIVSSLSTDAGPVQVRYVKSSSFDLGPAKEGSVYIVSVGDGSVNHGFVKDNSLEDVSDEKSHSGTDNFPDGQSDDNENADKISVMVIGPLEEPVTGWPFATEQSDSGETKLKSVLDDPNEQDQT